jgi:hypothetical protein
MSTNDNAHGELELKTIALAVKRCYRRAGKEAEARNKALAEAFSIAADDIADALEKLEEALAGQPQAQPVPVEPKFRSFADEENAKAISLGRSHASGMYEPVLASNGNGQH